jgi:hypothetical protein
VSPIEDGCDDVLSKIVYERCHKEYFVKKNLLKEKLQKGEIASGIILQDPAVQVVEVLGLLGFDWLFIDCKHSSMSVQVS